ncbi:MAG: zinc-dependent alcohol dehydrogenase family protein [Bryobacterales bacterium]|nr:zinc-dependent alcohol dehydrogenase family protein [Bryobacterales bacterium]
MKQVIMDRPGAPADVIRIVDAPEPPPPGPQQALVELAASPIHPADLLTIAGMYATTPGAMPKVPGKEGVGRVLKVGELVRHIKAGDLTPILLSNDGVWQERQLLDADSLVALPPGGDLLQYAMGFANPATALLMIRDVVPLDLGDWVIQNAANSSVGQYLVQIAKRRGIRTINVVRREGLAEKLHQLGADVVLTDGPDLPARVAKVIAGSPLKLAIDAVSGDASARLAACLSPNGVLCNYGMLSGKNVQVSPAALIGGGIVVKGFWLPPAMSAIGQDGRAKLFGELIALVSSGAIRAEVEATYPLANVQEALAHAARGERTGKIFLTLS